MWIYKLHTRIPSHHHFSVLWINKMWWWLCKFCFTFLKKKRFYFWNLWGRSELLSSPNSSDPSRTSLLLVCIKKWIVNSSKITHYYNIPSMTAPRSCRLCCALWCHTSRPSFSAETHHCTVPNALQYSELPSQSFTSKSHHKTNLMFFLLCHTAHGVQWSLSSWGFSHADGSYSQSSHGIKTQHSVFKLGWN